jgi:hypothetical protein
MNANAKYTVHPLRPAAALTMSGISRVEFAAALGLRRQALWRRVTSRTRWRLAEVHLAAEILGVEEGWLAEKVETWQGQTRPRDERQLEIYELFKGTPSSGKLAP